MRRTRIQTTPEFYEAVRQYQQIHRLPSWSQALLQLAAIGYRAETGQGPPTFTRPWGGKRDKREEQ